MKQKRMSKIEVLEKRLSILKGEDDKTKKFKFKDRKFFSLSKKASNKPEYVLVQYLMNNRRIKFILCKIISGNIIVINNKGHELNPKYTWIHGKHIWYIVREKDTKPVSVTDKITGWGTDDHPILMKMCLGALQKKELAEDKKKIIIAIVVLAVLGLIGWAIFGG
jgi:hypothetical protein